MITSTPPDVKPNIPLTRVPHPRPDPVLDVKPSISAATKSKDPIDFTLEANLIQQERERLEESHRLHTSNLDLREEMLQVKEENRRLKESQKAIKIEPVSEDVKPNMSKLGGGDKVTTAGSAKHEAGSGGSDDDEIIFIQEIKAGRYKRVNLDVDPSKSATAHTGA